VAAGVIGIAAVRRLLQKCLAERDKSAWVAVQDSSEISLSALQEMANTGNPEALIVVARAQHGGGSELLKVTAEAAAFGVLGVVAAKVVSDSVLNNHWLQAVQQLLSPKLRGHAFDMLRAHTEGRALAGIGAPADSALDQLTMYVKSALKLARQFSEESNRPQHPLLLLVPDSVNKVDGVSRVEMMVEEVRASRDAERITVALEPHDEQKQKYVAAFYQTIQKAVAPTVHAKLAAFLIQLKGQTVMPFSFSSRIKDERGMLDKLKRMQRGATMTLAHVYDVIGCRASFGCTRDLGLALMIFLEMFKTQGAPGAEILYMENYYAKPRFSPDNGFRLINIHLEVRADGVPYLWQMMLTTRCSQFAHDLYAHNTTHKPYVKLPSDEELEAKRGWCEAAALDHAEILNDLLTGDAGDSTGLYT